MGLELAPVAVSTDGFDGDGVVGWLDRYERPLISKASESKLEKVDNRRHRSCGSRGSGGVADCSNITLLPSKPWLGDELRLLGTERAFLGFLTSPLIRCKEAEVLSGRSFWLDRKIMVSTKQLRKSGSHAQVAQLRK